MADSRSRLIRRQEVEEMTGLKRSAIYLNVQKGEFPTPVKIGRRAVAWIEEEIQEWVDSRPRATVGGENG